MLIPTTAPSTIVISLCWNWHLENIPHRRKIITPNKFPIPKSISHQIPFKFQLRIEMGELRREVQKGTCWARLKNDSSCIFWPAASWHATSLLRSQVELMVCCGPTPADWCGSRSLTPSGPSLSSCQWQTNPNWSQIKIHWPKFLCCCCFDWNQSKEKLALS